MINKLIKLWILIKMTALLNSLGSEIGFNSTYLNATLSNLRMDLRLIAPLAILAEFVKLN